MHQENHQQVGARSGLFAFGAKSLFFRRGAIFASALLVLLSLGATSLSAARRVYESHQPLEKTVVKMLDQMSAAKMKFTVRKVYDRKADGKEGFVMYLAPRNTLCEITFRADPDQPKRSVIVVYTQDTRDSETLHRFFTQRMQLAEVGVTDEFDDSNPWPVRVR
ncbi:MAG: hypothetical protein NXI24_01385 [bacterium]|nr:hypothetical protein [bacterium]